MAVSLRQSTLEDPTARSRGSQYHLDQHTRWDSRNDDLGEMSSWYIFAAIGLYPEIPGRAELVIGSPLFPEITVHRKEGDLHITASDVVTQTPYVRSLLVNGKASTKTFLPESFTLHGGTLDFVLSQIPDKTWGTHPGDEPPSFSSK